MRLSTKTLAIGLSTGALPIIMAHAYTPSVTVLGAGGTYMSGWLDTLLPVYKDSQQLSYADLQLQASNTDAAIFSAGGGYRRLINNQGILSSALLQRAVALYLLITQ